MQRVLVVEDEPDLRELVLLHLSRAGLLADGAATGQEGLLAAQTTLPDLVILDLMLPDLSGIEVCQQLRAFPATAHLPIIMLTALGAEADRVLGLEHGADDYVTKPFSSRELVLRVQAVLRRNFRASELPEESQPLRVDAIVLDAVRHQVFVQQEEVKLTALEFRLLTALLTRQGEVLTRRQLLQDVWGLSPELQTRTVDTHIKRLRERLGPAGDAIETIRGVGYRYYRLGGP